MKVLLVTNMYPTKDYSYYGIFVKEQMDSIKKHFQITENIIFINGRRSVINYFLSLFQINWHLMWNKYDCIHLHYGLSGLFLLINPNIKTPIFLTLHGSDIDREAKQYFASFISKQVCKRVQKIYVVNERMKEMLHKHSQSKVEILPCGVDTTFFNPKSIGQKSINQISIGFPGDKNRKEKNYPLFEKVLNELSKKYILNPFVFHNKTRIEVRDGLNEMDVLLMTSTSEGSPQIIKEAMACNVPIVSTNVGDVQFLLQNVKNCYVIDSFNFINFINPFEQILGLENNKRKSNGRDRIFELGLDQKTIAKTLMNNYSLYTSND